VVQEVVLATRAIAILSDWQIEWSALGEAALWFQSKGYELPAVLRYPIVNLQDLLPVSNAAATWQLCNIASQRVPLPNLLKDSRSRLATQPVDKLYAAFAWRKKYDQRLALVWTSSSSQITTDRWKRCTAMLQNI